MAKDYLKKYAAPAQVGRFQMGGEMAPAEAAPAEQAPAGGGADLQGMLQQYAQTRDPQLAVQICDAILAEMGGGQEAAPAPAMAKGGRMNYQAPKFRKGGKLVG